VTGPAYLVAGVRTPIGRYGGALAPVRPDDLAAHAVRALTERLPSLDWATVDDVVLGCANQAGEDNRNVARMAALLAELPVDVAGVTVNRLCGSGLDAVAIAARAVRCGDADLVIAGGVESMSRAQDAFALSSQQRAAAAIARGRLAREIALVTVPQRRGEPAIVAVDEHPRQTSLDALAKLAPLAPGGSVTACNASGVNDGAVALLVASETAVARYGLAPLARITAGAVAGVSPRVMGIGPAPATRKLLARTGLGIADVDVVELNEAFASQALAVLRMFGLPDDAEHVNPNGGGIALGHPLGASGARLALTAALELHDRGARRALATMCIGVGQGIAVLLEAA
jgi:3-oxoadipyl-CoA thiolase